MAMMTPVRSQQSNTEDAYHYTPEVLGPGFLTPPSPYEGRRHSLASTQSSYCDSFAPSEYSAHADYSMDAVPSDLNQDEFVEVMPYERGPSGEVVPWPSQRELGANDGVYEQFVMLPPSNAFTSTSFSYNGYPVSRLMPGTVAQARGANGGDLIRMDPSNSHWTHESMVCWPDSTRNRGAGASAVPHLVDQIPVSRQEEALPFWNRMASSSMSPLGSMPGTIVPSDAVMEDFHLARSEELDSIRDTESSFVQTPQEVSFGRSISPEIKAERESDGKPQRTESRLETRMYVRSTGAKGVRKDQAEGSSRRKSRTPKSRGYDLSYGTPLSGPGNGLIVCSKSQYVCDLCGKRFKRPEHCKRHLRTHKPVVVANCTICNRAFNRNDNCISHYDTHIRNPGKKGGKNQNVKFGMRELEGKIRCGEIQLNAKIWEKLCQKYAHLKEEESDLSDPHELQS